MTAREQVEALVKRRIPAAITRITSGHGPMQVPVNDEDVDIVLADSGKALTTLLSELDAVKARTEWQPIKTAPKDGTRILLTGGVYWSDGGQGGMGTDEMKFDQIELGFFKRGEWWIGYGGGCYDEEYWAKPTHWMPLPSAPGGES